MSAVIANDSKEKAVVWKVVIWEVGKFLQKRDTFIAQRSLCAVHPPPLVNTPLPVLAVDPRLAQHRSHSYFLCISWMRFINPLLKLPLYF